MLGHATSAPAPRSLALLIGKLRGVPGKISGCSPDLHLTMLCLLGLLSGKETLSASVMDALRESAPPLEALVTWIDNS